MKVLVVVALIVAAFGGGVYAGMEYHKSELRSDPKEFKELLKDEAFQKMMTEEMKNTAKDKASKIWDVLTEDL